MTYEEAIEALKLINTSRVHPFYDWEEMSEVRDIAIEALEKQRKSNAHNKCYVVIQQDYATGGNISVYKDESDARRSVIEDVETVKKELLEDGHEPIANWDALRNPEVIVADSNIYFEWEIIETNIL